MKSAEEYDYSQDVISGKMEEDLDYIMNGDDGDMMSRWLKTIKRDWNAKDNMAVQDISALAELGATIIPGRILLRGTAKLIKYESVIDISKFTKRIRGTGNMMDVKTGYYISPTKGIPHGEGAVWKLFDKEGRRIGTFDKDGRYLRK